MAPQDSAGEWRLREAVKIFTSLGAVTAARITGQKMRQLGIRPVPAGPRVATRAPPPGLTRREQEALDLISAPAALTPRSLPGCSSPLRPPAVTSRPCWRNWTPHP